MDCRVVVEAAVPVYDVETPDEAVRIAIAKTGEMLNPDLNYVEISMGSRESPSGEELPPAFIAADEALVALELEMTVFNVEQEEHASRIARKEIGGRLESIPLAVLEVERIESGDEEGTDEETEGTDEGTNPKSPVESNDDDDAGDDENESVDGDVSGGEDESDDLLPEFEDLVEES